MKSYKQVDDALGKKITSGKQFIPKSPKIKSTYIV